ncbi:hypothetical protein PVAND_003401 [Polypedilum vanderplanki]|uniref:COMM domain-containing protein n=1 Tax=Polypedilum vanderplanki TaxID=319348 RepID=A0A9J6BVP0_POLVA|nr:hypothetical protein PVAND_003401 [Polypedilum vanderplanki]
MWYHKKKKFLDGIEKCLKLSDNEFEQLVDKINEIYKASEDDLSALQEVQIKNDSISNDEKVLILKTIYYLIQRFNIFILSPIKLQSDLNNLGFTSEKSQILGKIYSEISRPLITNVDMNTSTDEEVNWQIKTTLSEPANQKCKILKAHITLKNKNQKIVFDDLIHSELTNLFDKIEIIQSELDNLNK